jgi:hypothetical protein
MGHRMLVQAPDDISFLNMNVLFIGFVALVVFIYFVLLLRRRWKNKFLHQSPKNPKRVP